MNLSKGADELDIIYLLIISPLIRHVCDVPPSPEGSLKIKGFPINQEKPSVLYITG
jgi:hypothetical protein